MNQTNGLQQQQQRPSPLHRPVQGIYKSTDSSKHTSQSRKKSGSYRYQQQKQNNFEIYTSNMEQPQKSEHSTDLQIVSGFFFKGQKNNNPLINTPLTTTNTTPFRKSPSFRVKHQFNQSNDSRLNNQSDRMNNQSDRQNNQSDSSDTKVNKSIRSDNPLRNEKQNERINRIQALENYVKDIGEEEKNTPKHSPKVSGSMQNTQITKPHISSLQNTQMSTKPQTNSVSKAYESSILDDLEANIEEMHFYFVEFQQKSKQWMTKIETKHKRL